MIESDTLHTLLEILCPVRVGGTELRFGSLASSDGEGAYENDHGDLLATINVICYDKSEGKGWSVNNIKQQEVLFVPMELRDHSDERLRLCLEGWAMALRVMFEDNPEHIETVMPNDLVFPRALSLVRPKTADDFCAKFLVKSRLGKGMKKYQST